MTITIEGPDGASIDFPDETSESEMNAAMAQAYPAPAQGGGGVMGALKGASRALEANLPFVDRAVAAAKTNLPRGYGGGLSSNYATNLATEQGTNAQFAKDNPWTNFAGAGAVGTAASGGLMMGPLFGLGGLTGAMTQAAVPSAVWGGLQGASNAPDLTDLSQTGVARDALIGAGTGGALGAAAPLVAAGVGKAFSPLAAALRSGPGAADVAKLGSDVTAAYQNVKNLGASYSPAQVQGLMEKIASDAADADIDPSLNPKAASIISNLQARAAAKAKSGEAVTLPELDRMRQFVNDNLGGLPEPKQARFGALIKANIDDFIKNAEPQATVPRGASAAPNFNPAAGPDTNYVAPGMGVEGGGDAGVSAAMPQRPVNPNLAAPPSLVTFLSRMGVKDEGGDLASMGFTKYPGLVRPMSGVPMDEARRAAAEAGYLDSDTTVDDLLDKLAKHPTYAQGADEDAAARRSDYQSAMAEYRRAVDEAAPSQIEQFVSQDSPNPLAEARANSMLAAQMAARNGSSAAPALVPPAPSASDAYGAIQSARDLAMRQFKVKALADALSKAGINADVAGTGGNIENATRRRLASILEKEPWSQDEIDQINRMIHGTPLTNTLRQFGRFGPRGNALMGALELGSGSPRAIVAAVGGSAAQAGEALARRAGQAKLLATILAGGKAPVLASGPGPTRSALAAALAARQQLPPQRNTGQ